MKVIMTPVDRLPSSRSRKDYEGQAAALLKQLNEQAEGSSHLLAEGAYNELNAVAGHLRASLGKENVVVRRKEVGSEVYELYAKAAVPF